MGSKSVGGDGNERSIIEEVVNGKAVITHSFHHFEISLAVYQYHILLALVTI